MSSKVAKIHGSVNLANSSRVYNWTTGPIKIGSVIRRVMVGPWQTEGAVIGQ